MVNLDPKQRKETLTLIFVFIGVLLASGFAAYFLAAKNLQSDARRVVTQSEREAAAQSTPAPSQVAGSDNPFLGGLEGTPPAEARMSDQSWGQIVSALVLRLLLAALLAAVLAFRPRRSVLKRNPYVSQTQILLAVVASALMIIVGDNTARAFGIFAAVSVVRFRTNIRDPKEVTVLLISLAIGLATGVGRWELAVVLAIFAVILLWILEYREPQQVFRKMELKIGTRNINSTQEVLRAVIGGPDFDAELRTISIPKGDDEVGSLVYAVDVSPSISTNELSQQILNKDLANVDCIEWEEKKTSSYVFQ